MSSTEQGDGRAAPMGPPSQSPCGACPYRRRVPSGIWSFDEYEKLRIYDHELIVRRDDGTYGVNPAITVDLGGGQYSVDPSWLALFQCHQNDEASPAASMCSGWVGCHRPAQALRTAVVRGSISTETLEAAMNYRSPVPLFASGAEAADHGQADIDAPGRAARRAIDQITRKRTDLLFLDTTDPVEGQRE